MQAESKMGVFLEDKPLIMQARFWKVWTDITRQHDILSNFMADDHRSRLCYAAICCSLAPWKDWIGHFQNNYWTIVYCTWAPVSCSYWVEEWQLEIFSLNKSAYSWCWDILPRGILPVTGRWVSSRENQSSRSMSDTWQLVNDLMIPWMMLLKWLTTWEVGWLYLVPPSCVMQLNVIAVGFQRHEAFQFIYVA